MANSPALIWSERVMLVSLPTKTKTVLPLVYLSNVANAVPTTVSPVAVAFLPTPATEDRVILSPIAIAPPSRFTFTGTCPASEIMALSLA